MEVDKIMGDARTAAILERSLKSIGGATQSDLRANRGRLPLVLERGEGSRVWDVDGVEYIDYMLGGGPTVLGHCHPAVVEAMRKQLGKGIMFGAQTELDIRLAERIREIVPCAEVVRFGCSGTEVNHAAVRLARGCTQKPKVLRFEGHYHGWYDTMGWDSDFRSGKAGPREAPCLQPLSPAQPSESCADLLFLPWNDLGLVRDLFSRQGDSIAAVFTEPVMSHGGIDPLPGYLEGLREVCDEYGSLLIFDEVVTGFRWALGGAQEYFGVTPDLATFAKCLGGGAVVSALAGRDIFMRRWSEFSPVLAGTFNGNPLSMAAALATLEILAENDKKLLRRSYEITDLLAKGLKRLAVGTSLPLTVRQFPSSLFVSFVPKPSETIVDARSLMQTDFIATQEFGILLQQHGIRVAYSGGWGISTAHTEEDVTETLRAVESALDEMELMAISFQPQVSKLQGSDEERKRKASPFRRFLKLRRA